MIYIIDLGNDAEKIKPTPKMKVWLMVEIAGVYYRLYKKPVSYSKWKDIHEAAQFGAHVRKVFVVSTPFNDYRCRFLCKKAEQAGGLF